MKVAVLDTKKKSLAPTTPRRASLLLKKGKAAVFRRFPFTIILKREVSDVQTPTLKVKIDPGSKTSGIAIVNQETGEVVLAAEIEHRGQAIKAKLDARRAIRHSRRSRKTRYRKPRFLNRARPKGFLPPSLESRVDNIETWVRRLNQIYPLSGISLELVRFDTQLMQNPEINGIEYQHSTPEKLDLANLKPLRVKATGHNSRQMCRVDKYGFPRTGAKAARRVRGFRTGDLVKAVVPSGKKAGVMVGRVAVRSSGSFNLLTVKGTVQGISWRHCRRLHAADGFHYQHG